MNHYTLLRSYLPDRTHGQIQGHGLAMTTIERPWLDNKPNVSCIPEGTYIVRPDDTGRFQYYRVDNVPLRSHIEFHHGERPEHSNGCILLDATEFKEKQGEESFMLTIRSFNVYTDRWL